MDENTIEQCRWRAQRILKADEGRCDQWQRNCAMAFLSATKPGKQPSERVIGQFRRAWSQYWFTRTSREPDHYEVFE